MKNEMPICISRVTKRFGDRLVLDDVSLDISPGETVALIGPSGGGKSTLLRCLNGLNSFDSGEIRIGQNKLQPVPRKGTNGNPAQQVCRQLGMIFQDFQLFPHLTVLQNIIEAPIRVLGVRKQQAVAQANQLLERVGLGDRGNAYPRQLSGGQKQRVAIARALAMKPHGLLCDEITSALDPELKMEVLAVLEDLKREGMTLLMVTHEIGFARKAADRVVVLAGGKIVEDGPPSQVIDQPQNERTRSFLSRVLG
jgi:ABC-type polar amino acid transport system ATPase subunit